MIARSAAVSDFASAAPVRRLAGMRDWSGAAGGRRRAVQGRLAGFIEQYGYEVLEAPALEATELFLRKSGGSLASRMYSFTDPGANAVSLRPEFTASVMRHYLETAGYGDGDGDVGGGVARWQYAGPVFRYDPEHAAGSGQFTQVGAERIGGAAGGGDSVAADAELLALAAGAVSTVGIGGYRLRLADLDVVDSVLDTVGLSERGRAFIVANMNRIGMEEDGIDALLRRASELRIIAGGALPEDEANLAAAVSGLPDEAAREVLAGFMRWRVAGASGSPLGQRTPEEIVDRLLHKLRGGDDPDALRRGLTLAGRLASIGRGSIGGGSIGRGGGRRDGGIGRDGFGGYGGGRDGRPAAAVAAIRAVADDAGAQSGAVDRLAELVALVSDEPALRGHLVINFALARGIAYYNGIIFDIVAGDGDRGGAPGSSVLGGGGRYDGLARALGSVRDVPALGFACTLETLLEAMPVELTPGTETGSTAAAPGTGSARPGSAAADARVGAESAAINRNGD